MINFNLPENKVKKPPMIFILSVVFILIGCEKHYIEYTENPFSTFNKEVQEISTENTKTLLASLDIKDASKVPGVWISDDYFDFAEISDSSSLLYSNKDEQLYIITDNINGYKGEKIAERGRGPDQIQNGIKLQRVADKISLIQRHRISELRYDSISNKYQIEAKRNIPIYLNYYRVNDETSTALINTYTFENKSTFQLRNIQLNSLQETIGGFTNCEIMDINKMYNFNFISSLENGDYIQAFLFLPYFGVFSNEFKLKHVYKTSDFSPTKLSMQDFDEGKATIINEGRVTVLAGLHSLKEGAWLVYENRIYETDDKSYKKNYNYFIIKSEEEPKFVGSSKFYAVPFNKKLLYLKNGEIFLSSYSILDKG